MDRAMKVFLVHGMGRTRASLLVLRSRLKSAALEPHLFGYSVAREPFDGIVQRFVEVVASATDGEAYGIVGHSLGNVIARAALPRLPRGLSRIVMLAPPNRPPLLASKLAGNPIFSWLTGDAGKSLAAPSFYEKLPVPEVPVLVLAGTAGPKASWLPHGDEPSDGVVTVSETRLEGARHREVPCVHTLIMNDREVARLAAEFLTS
jgi:hypothetical protein